MAGWASEKVSMYLAACQANQWLGQSSIFSAKSNWQNNCFHFHVTTESKAKESTSNCYRRYAFTVGIQSRISGNDSQKQVTLQFITSFAARQ